MRLAFIYPDLLRAGGVPYETRCLIRGLAAAGVDVRIFADLRDAERNQQIITTFGQGDDQRRFLQEFQYNLREIGREIGTCDAAVLIGCRRASYRAIGLLLARRRVPYFVFAHGLLSPRLMTRTWGGNEKPRHRQLLERLYRRVVTQPLVRRATAVRALSQHEADQARASGAADVFVVPDGVDRSWLLPRPRRPAGDPLRLLYLGRPQIDQKGLDIVVRALHQLPDEAMFELILAGPFTDADVSALASLSGGALPCQVRTVGSVDGLEKRELLHTSDLFLHVSRYEGMAKAVREAVGHGCPVLASAQSNFGDHAARHGMGLSVDAEPSACAEALRRFGLSDPREREAMSEAATAFAREWSWDRVAVNVREEIESRIGLA